MSLIAFKGRGLFAFPYNDSRVSLLISLKCYVAFMLLVVRTSSSRLGLVLGTPPKNPNREMIGMSMTRVTSFSSELTSTA